MYRPHAVCALALALAACATTQTSAVPAALDPPADQSLAMVVRGKGVQVYECRARKGGDGFEWAFVAPEADLFDRYGRHLGTHGAGPYWQAQDGSLVIGTVKARADAPVAGAIPWLLLATTSSGPDGALRNVSSIQRVNTSGGIAPSAGCGPQARGTLARVAYTADYRLFAAK